MARRRGHLVLRVSGTLVFHRWNRRIQIPAKLGCSKSFCPRLECLRIVPFEKRIRQREISAVRLFPEFAGGAYIVMYVYAPRTRATRQPTGHRVLSTASPGFLTVPQGGMSAPPADLRKAGSHGQFTIRNGCAFEESSRSESVRRRTEGVHPRASAKLHS